MISLKNQNVAEIVGMRLNKLENEFLETELEKIIDLVYDGNYSEENDDLSDLRYFNKLTSLNLINFIIGKKESKNIFTIPSIKELIFDNVSMEYYEFLKEMNLNRISFINVQINNFDFISQLTKINYLEIVNARELNAKLLENNTKLTTLRLSYSNIKNIDILEKFKYLEVLDIDNTNIVDISFLLEWKKLKKISVTEEQIKNNKDTIKKLKENKVKIYIENAMEY